MTGPISPKILGSTIALLGGGAVLAALTISSGSSAWGPRIVPMLAGATMILAGLGVVFERSLAQADKEGGDEARAIWLVGLAVGYIFAIGLVGYLLATALAAPVVLALFGTRSPARLIIAAVLCPAVLHVFFFELLGIFPPRAVWDLADCLPF